MGLAERLHARGWSQEEIDHALTHMAWARKQKSVRSKFIAEGLSWLNMLILVAANVTIAWFLFPFLAQLPRSLSTSIVAVLGVIWGVLFAHLGHEIAELEPRHHAFVLFASALTVIFTALWVHAFSVVLAIVFGGVFVLYYSYVWWRHVV